MAQPNPDTVIKARVEVIEPMGSEIYLYLGSGKHSFVARVSTSQSAEVNQELSVALNMRRAHFFDASTGASLV